MYHFRDGWLFHRAEDGTIKVQVRDYHEDEPIDDAAVLSSIEIDPEEWASIIAGLSAEGANESTVGMIHIFHQGGLPAVIETLISSMTFEDNTQASKKNPWLIPISLSIATLLISISFCLVWVIIRRF